MGVLLPRGRGLALIVVVQSLRKGGEIVEKGKTEWGWKGGKGSELQLTCTGVFIVAEATSAQR